MMSVLVLHGYNQSSEIILKRCQDILPRGINYTIPDGPLVLGDGKYGWFPLSREEIIHGKCTVSEDILDAINITGHYDCVIGFSQGCLIATYLLARKKITTSKLILFSPIPSPNIVLRIAASVKCVGFIGDADDLVPPVYSENFLRSHIENLTIYRHSWGHVIPTKSEYKKIYAAFLK